MDASPINVTRLTDDCVLTVTVKVTRRFRVRIWCAVSLIRFAWWIAGGRVEVVELQ